MLFLHAMLRGKQAQLNFRHQIQNGMVSYFHFSLFSFVLNRDELEFNFTSAVVLPKLMFF